MRKQRILLVDDEPAILQALERVLKLAREPWELRFVGSAADALRELDQGDFDAVISDIRMPGKDGLALLAEIRAADRTRDLPVIIVSGAREPGLKRQALDLGATDLLSKPADPDELIARARSALRLKAYQDELKAQNAVLERRVAERTAELEDSRIDIIWRLGKAAEFRDEDTGHHVMRVGCFARVIAEQMDLPHQHVDRIFLAAPLHDIGKIGIPDHILLKPDALTPSEWVTMKRHCELGAQILRQQSHLWDAYLGWRQPGTRTPRADRNPLLEMAANIALRHHERWDGLGYPGGLAGGDIPLEARITAIADVYDALLSERPYRGAFPEEIVLRTLQAGAGGHFDPDVHAAFLAALPELQEIRTQFADDPQRVPAWT